MRLENGKWSVCFGLGSVSGASKKTVTARCRVANKEHWQKQ